MENKEPTKNIDAPLCPKPSKKISGGILALVGYILSPLSWWNDPIINIPLAYFFALPFGLITKSFFMPAMIIGYWGTNVLGLLLIHHGAKKIFNQDRKQQKKQFLKNIIIATSYTALIFLLAKTNFLNLPDFGHFLKK